MIGATMKSVGCLAKIEQAEACIYTLQYGDVSEQERKNLLNEVRSISLDSTFWVAAALAAKGEDLRKLCVGKALVGATKEEMYPIVRLFAV